LWEKRNTERPASLGHGGAWRSAFRQPGFRICLKDHLVILSETMALKNHPGIKFLVRLTFPEKSV
jgi:hypothetical protein